MPRGPERPPARALHDLLGLAARARAVTFGTDATRAAVREGEARCVILAADGSPTQAQKLLPLLEARGVPSWGIERRSLRGSRRAISHLLAIFLRE